MDDSEPEFPIPTRRELEIMKNYFDVESEFIAVTDFFTVPRTILFRNLAVSIIAKLSRSDDPDSFIPYLAMNYFDRFLSQHKLNLEDVEGRTETERVRLIAVSCLTISAKMRTNSFSVDRFLENLYRDMNVRITPPMVMRMELLILQELQWAMRSVTAFCFLNYYYPYFKKFCGFKRRSINEIIVQAQGEHTFAHYMPSQIAISAFLAAAKTEYPSKYSEIAKDIKSKIGLQGQMKECVKKMVDLCNRLNIQIETTESGTRSTTSKVAAVPQEEIKEAGTPEEDEDEEWTGLIKQVQDMRKKKTCPVQVLVQAEELPDDEITVASGNEVMVPDTSDKKDVEETSLAKGKGKAVDVDDDKSRVEAIIQRALAKEPRMERSISEIAEVVVPKKLMNFELKWPTDVPSLEVDEIQYPRPRQSFGCIIS